MVKIYPIIVLWVLKKNKITIEWEIPTTTLCRDSWNQNQLLLSGHS